MTWVSSVGDDTALIKLYVQPKSSRAAIVGIHDDMVKLCITAAPVDGKANKAVIAFMAKFLHVPKKEVNIISGERSRKKHCVIGCLSEKDVRERIEKVL